MRAKTEYSSRPVDASVVAICVTSVLMPVAKQKPSMKSRKADSVMSASNSTVLSRSVTVPFRRCLLALIGSRATVVMSAPKVLMAFGSRRNQVVPATPRAVSML